MSLISGNQVRAARALIGWSQLDLANAANIGEMTVKRFESAQNENGGTIKTLQAIQEALEDAGIIFIQRNQHGGLGVRLKLK